MIRIAIVEDDIEYCKILQTYLEMYEKENGVEFEYSVFHDGDGILEKGASNFDIILLDIQMPFVDGLTAAKEIRKHDEKVVIIFVTTVAQYAITGYKVGALDYILKPIEYFPFSQTLRKACNKLEREEHRFVIFRVKSGINKVEIDTIYYIESLRHTLCVHTASGTFEAYGTLRELEEQLGGDNFCRGNKGYLINLKYVSAIKGKDVIVKGDSLLLSRGRREEFLQALLKYWEGK